MLHTEKAIIVEGRYDKARLSGVVDALIITTDGFGIFNSKEKQAFIKKIAAEKGILILTDSDAAGFKIRNFLKNIVPEDRITHAYIPDIYGKEKRKEAPSKEGKLGVEGVPDAVIIQAVEKSGALTETPPAQGGIKKADLYDLGLSGGKNSAARRERLLKELELPQRLSPNALLEVLNCITDLPALQALMERWEEENG